MNCKYCQEEMKSLEFPAGYECMNDDCIFLNDTGDRYIDVDESHVDVDDLGINVEVEANLMECGR